MKKLSFVCIGLALAFTVAAQGHASLTLNVNGNRTTSVTIDGTTYMLSNSNPTHLGTIINDLAPGQHTLQVTRTRNNFRQSDISTTFTLRNRYDMRINVNDDGSLELMETMRYRNNNNNASARINAQDYNSLMYDVRSRRTPEQRRQIIANAFSGSDNRYNYFTSNQVAQLLQYVPADGDRLQLAKAGISACKRPGKFFKGRIVIH